jgi:hypothetical protein
MACSMRSSGTVTDRRLIIGEFERAPIHTTALRAAERGAIYSTTIASALASSLRRHLRRLANRLDKFLRRAEAGGQ